MKRRMKGSKVGQAALAAAAVLGTVPTLAMADLSSKGGFGEAKSLSNPAPMGTDSRANIGTVRNDADIERSFYDWVHFNVYKTQIAGSTATT